MADVGVPRAVMLLGRRLAGKPCRQCVLADQRVRSKHEDRISQRDLDGGEADLQLARRGGIAVEPVASAVFRVAAAQRDRVSERTMRLKAVWQLTVLLVAALEVLPCQAPGPTSARASADSATVARLEQQVEDAVVRRDAAFLDVVYAPSFRFKHATGTLETRDARMANLRRPIPPDAPGRMVARRVDSLEVEVHGDVALSTGRIHVLRDGGEPRWQNYTVRYVRLWSRSATGHWQLLTHHSTSDSQGPPAPISP